MESTPFWLPRGLDPSVIYPGSPVSSLSIDFLPVRSGCAPSTLSEAGARHPSLLLPVAALLSLPFSARLLERCAHLLSLLISYYDFS